MENVAETAERLIVKCFNLRIAPGYRYLLGAEDRAVRAGAVEQERLPVRSFPDLNETGFEWLVSNGFWAAEGAFRDIRTLAIKAGDKLTGQKRETKDFSRPPLGIEMTGFITVLNADFRSDMGIVVTTSMTEPNRWDMYVDAETAPIRVVDTTSDKFVPHVSAGLGAGPNR